MAATAPAIALAKEKIRPKSMNSSVRWLLVVWGDASIIARGSDKEVVMDFDFIALLIFFGWLAWLLFR